MHPAPKHSRRRHNGIFDFNLLEPRNLLAGDIICTGDADNVIVARVSAADPNMIEIEVDGVVSNTFDIASPELISIDAQLGNDTFLLDFSNGAPITAGGFAFNGGEGVDTLESNNAVENFFVFELQAESDGTLGDFLTFSDVEELVGGAGADRFDVRSIDRDIRVDGLGGDDVFRLGSTVPDFFNGVLTELDGEILIEGGSGQNRILLGGRGGGGLNLIIHQSFISGHNGEFSINYISNGGSFTNSDGSIGGITIFGSNFVQDVFTVSSFLESNTIKLRTSAGNDIFRVSAQALGDVELDGGAGSDVSEVDFVGSGSRRVLFESIGFGRLIAFGTAGDDQFESIGEDVFFGSEVISSDENVVVAGGDGDDTFVIGGDANQEYQGGAGNDLFITTDTADNVFALGGFGEDRFDLTAPPASGRFFGGADDDTFFGRNSLSGSVRLDGQLGSDSYQFQIFPVAVFSRLDASDSVAAAGDVDVHEFTMIGEVIATVSDFSLTVTFPNLAPQNTHFISGSELVTINTGDTDDDVRVGGFRDVIVNTGAGDDVITIGRNSDVRRGGHLEINAGSGFNRLELGFWRINSPEVRFDVDDAGATTIEGGDGIFTVRAVSPDGVFNTADNTGGISVEGFNLDSTGDDIVIIDGLLAENSFELNGRQRTFNIGSQALGDFTTGLLRNSTVEIQESGTERVINLVSIDEESDFNTVNIIGSDDAEAFVVANRFFSWGSIERVVFDAATNRFNVFGGGGDDSFEVIATLAGVETTLYGATGADSFVLGGGNLNSLDGEVTVLPGGGVDTLLIDDSQALSAYSYHIDLSRIFSIPGPASAERPDFAGINFGNFSLENLTLQGSIGNNLVRARATSTTDINLIGGAGVNAVDLITVPFDGHVLELDGEDSGRWTFDFAFRDLVFADFEIQAES